MPVKTIDKNGIPQRLVVAEVNVPIIAIKPTGFKETAPGIVTKAIGDAVPSLNVPKERMGAARPWISKAGHAVAAANAHDPAGSKPSMKFKAAPKGGPTGPTGTPAGQANAGGYVGASGSGGYS